MSQPRQGGRASHAGHVETDAEKSRCSISIDYHKQHSEGGCDALCTVSVVALAAKDQTDTIFKGYRIQLT